MGGQDMWIENCGGRCPRRHALFLMPLAVACAVQSAPDVSLFDYDAKAPLDFHDNDAQDVSGFKVHAISYASPKGGKVPAFLAVPRAMARSLESSSCIGGKRIVRSSSPKRSSSPVPAPSHCSSTASSIGRVGKQTTSPIPKRRSKATSNFLPTSVAAWICCNHVQKLTANVLPTSGTVMARPGAERLPEWSTASLPMCSWAALRRSLGQQVDLGTNHEEVHERADRRLQKSLCAAGAENFCRPGAAVRDHVPVRRAGPLHHSRLGEDLLGSRARAEAVKVVRHQPRIQRSQSAPRPRPVPRNST
jgi:hypothetical protein